MQDLVILNGAGAPQLASALGYYNHGGDGVQTAALLVQEHHACGPAFDDLALKAKGKRWLLRGAPASKLETGWPSAGVCIAVRNHINLGLPPGWQHDISPHASPGRLCAAWIEGLIRGGLLVMSIYLWDSEGLTPRNRELLEQAGEFAKKLVVHGCLLVTSTCRLRLWRMRLLAGLERLGRSLSNQRASLAGLRGVAE